LNIVPFNLHTSITQVYENWRKRLKATCTSSRILDAYCEQVSVCTEIGLNSMETERGKRPSIMEIIDRLDETETMIEKVNPFLLEKIKKTTTIRAQ
jgi:hypothetical protein